MLYYVKFVREYINNIQIIISIFFFFTQVCIKSVYSHKMFTNRALKCVFNNIEFV